MSILNEELVESLNDDQLFVKAPEVEDLPNEDTPEDISAPPESETVDDLPKSWDIDDDDDDEGLEAYADDLEGLGLSSMAEDEADSLAESALDLMIVAKDGLSELYESKFSKQLKKRFGAKDKLPLILVESLYLEDKLTIDNCASLLKSVQGKSEEFKSVLLVDLLEVGNAYKSLRKRYQSKPINDKVGEGIKRNARLTLKKYMGANSVDPSFLLLFYIVAAFSGDAVNLYSIIKEDKTA